MPIHVNALLVGTSDLIFVTLFDFESFQAHGGTDPVTTVGTGGIGLPFAGIAESTYQPISATLTVIIPLDEGIPLGDSIFLSATLTLDDDGIPLGDEVLTYVPVYTDDDGIPLGDDLDLSVTISIEEGLPLGDELFINATLTLDDDGIPLGDDDPYCFAPAYLDENQPLGDELLLTATLSLDDVIPLGDSVEVAQLVELDDGQPLGDGLHVRLDFDADYSTKIKILTQSAAEFSTQIQIPIFSPPASNILTSPSNPFSPVVVINGVIYAGSPAPGVTDLIDMSRSIGVLGISCAAEVIDWSINLNFIGGTFEVRSYGVTHFLGDTASICGLTGMVTAAGWSEDPSKGETWLVRGVFGSRNLDRQLLLYAQNSPIASGIVMGTVMKSAPIGAWSTISACANQLSRAAGIQLIWQASDGPLIDAFPESGMTVGQALQSLAARVGAIVCWQGSPDTFTVIPPDFGTGGWGGFVDCSLINNLDVVNLLDENRDYVTLPVNSTINTSVRLMNSALVPPPVPVKVPLYSTRTKQEDGSVASYVDLNPDFDGDDALNGKIQIIVNPPDVGDPFTTSNPDTWFDADIPVNTERFTGVKKLVLSALPFPASLDDNQFFLKLGYTRKLDLLAQQAQNAFTQGVEAQKTILNLQQQKLRYIRTSTFQVSGQFAGSVPLPGQGATVHKNHATGSGTMESVAIQGGQNSLTTIQVGGAHYQRIEVLSATQYIDFLYATGGGMQPSP